MKLEKAAVLEARVKGETVEVKVPKGAEIKILGASTANQLIPERLWVELEDGTRGHISCEYFDVKYEAVLDGGKKPQPVEGQWDGYGYFIVQLEDCTTDKLYADDVYPIWPKSWKFKYVSGSSISSSYMSLSKFEDKYIGSTFDENDKRQFPAKFVVNKDGLIYAYYDVTLLDTSTGLRHTPTIVYNSEGVAESYILGNPKKKSKVFP